MPIVKIVPHKKLWPYLGYCHKNGTIEISDALDSDEQNFVLDHELYHLDDKTKWWVWREVRANVYAARREPMGFLKVVWRTINDYKRIIRYLREKGQGR